MFCSNCCFLTCIQISQEADKVDWYSQVFKNFSQSVVIHTVKGFCIVNEAEADIFLEYTQKVGTVGESQLFTDGEISASTSLMLWTA